jgi:DNA-binding LytR/AlgR family response regulator
MLASMPCVVNSLELSGTYDMIVEASLPEIGAYHDLMQELADPLAQVVARYETNFVCKRYVVRNSKIERAVWVPCHEGHRRIDCSKIDKIVAEGDYMRVFVGDNRWLLHTTMKEITKKLDPAEFATLHRSLIVRTSFIERLIHQGRNWSARLNDGTVNKIARSHISEVLRVIKVDSSKPLPVSSTPLQVNEKAEMA